MGYSVTVLRNAAGQTVVSTVYAPDTILHFLFETITTMYSRIDQLYDALNRV